MIIRVAPLAVTGCHQEVSIRAGDPVVASTPLAPPTADPAGVSTAPVLVSAACQAPPATGLSLCLNELQSNNDATWQPGAPGEFPDWLELYNPGTVAIDAAWVALAVGDDPPAALSGEPIAPGEHRVVVLDDQALPDHVDRRLSSDGERVTVTVRGLGADAVDLPALGDDLTYGRFPDGGDWVTTCTATPGLGNAGGACEDSLDWVFETGRIHDLHLTLSPDAWAGFESSQLFAPVAVPATLSFDGGEFPLVEVSPKGGYGTFRADLDTEKCAFEVDLNAYDDHEWHGLKRLTLNNLVQDELLAYTLFREAGMPAPRVAYARVDVNGVYFGLYALIEPVDHDFLERWYGDGSGHLFEAAYGPDFDVGDEALFEYDDGPDRAEGEALIAQVSELLAYSSWDDATFATLDGWVDMDEVVTNLAVEQASWHWDSYTTENNYYLYRDPGSGRWSIVPHGADQTWHAGWPNPYEPDTMAEPNWFCLAVPACADLYHQKLLDVADAVDRAQLEPLLDTLVAVTDPEFAVEPRAEMTDLRSIYLHETRARIETAASALRDAAATH